MMFGWSNVGLMIWDSSFILLSVGDWIMRERSSSGSGGSGGGLIAVSAAVPFVWSVCFGGSAGVGDCIADE